MKYYKTMTKYNCGIDLHTRQMYICVMDLDGNILVHRNIRNNDFAFFLKLVEPYKDDLTVTCESCFVCWAIPFGHCFRKLKPRFASGWRMPAKMRASSSCWRMRTM